MKEQIELAERFDKLIYCPGWEDALKFLGNRVNNELLSATEKPYEPEMQRIHVVRWDSKRDLVDSLVSYIESTRRSRDEIVEQFTKKEEVDGGTSNTAGY